MQADCEAIAGQWLKQRDDEHFEKELQLLTQELQQLDEGKSNHHAAMGHYYIWLELGTSGTKGGLGFHANHLCYEIFVDPGIQLQHYLGWTSSAIGASRPLKLVIQLYSNKA
jgi:hypothetical protein